MSNVIKIEISKEVVIYQCLDGIVQKNHFS